MMVNERYKTVKGRIEIAIAEIGGSIGYLPLRIAK
jgi:hypothetical protein